MRAAAGELQRAAGELSLPLVARDGDGQVVGALLGVPSGTVVSGLARMPVAKQQILMSMLVYAKIKAVAVSEDVRGHGIGAALIAQCVQLYRQLDYTLLFGEFDTTRPLGPTRSRASAFCGPGRASMSGPCSPASRFISVPDRASPVSTSGGPRTHESSGGIRVWARARTWRKLNGFPHLAA
ncbi:GNAT family N-acetyltransferase [Streptomyces griseoruber]|uniref:GNAT family N-acetyltransferase n=1 Tax=Streptomyces griseoruber TaxID=1943 RepID=UPI000A56B04D|nr:GNAT family N-acetyltransferase [Streptomyces griseoruber]